MKIIRLAVITFALMALTGGRAPGVEADELAHFLGIYSWRTKVTLTPDTYSVEILQIKNGAVAERLLMPTSNIPTGGTGEMHIMLGPILDGPHRGNYRTTIAMSGWGIFGSTTRIPLFDSARSNPMPKEVAEGDFVIFGVPKNPFVGANDSGSYSNGFMLRVKKFPVSSGEAQSQPVSR